ncbi:MAG: FAD-binding oxidoreductase [Nitrospiraceae bacterium]|nr:FAD-binding oxidoreductase [Nitrospiraceae bacterium]
MTLTETYLEKREHASKACASASSTKPLALHKESSNLFRHREQTKVQRLDLRAFNHVLHIDREGCYADVEGLATYEDVVAQTLPFNLMPAVVPQLKTITVGGAIAGIGIESSSFRYGFVHETMSELDILLADGRVITATRQNEYRDLFLGFPNSYGTLGYALRARIALIPVKPFVQLTHRRVADPVEYFRHLSELCRSGGVDFVDGTMFDGGELYATTGRFVDRADRPSDYTYLDIYYQSIRAKSTDFLTTQDYLWRWDTDWFWCSKHFLLQHAWMRRLWGRKRLRSAVYWKLWQAIHRSRSAQTLLQLMEGRQEPVIQDVEIPIEHAAEFAGFLESNIGIRPVWICPVATLDPSITYPLYPMDPARLYVNFGFWDVVPSDREDGYYNRMVEAKVRDLDGRKSLYSNSYYSREEFGRLYNEPAYRALKQRYDPTGRLKHLYDKCVLKR